MNLYAALLPACLGMPSYTLENIRVVGNIGKVATLAVRYAIFKKHRHAIELNSVYLNAGVAEIMHIVIKPVDIGSIKAVIVVATNKNLVAIR